MSQKVAGQFLCLPTLNLPEAMPRRSLKPAAKPLIAPEPCFPGAAGAVGIDVSKANFHACYLAGSKARPQVLTSRTAISSHHLPVILEESREPPEVCAHHPAPSGSTGPNG